MKGNNEMVLNTATMMEIVQYYLDNKLLNKDEHSPTVTGFALNGRAPLDNTFVVSLSSDTGGEGGK
ncbi:conserved protein of unknown function [Hyphomicrobium sp. 1Nfss2.1]